VTVTLGDIMKSEAKVEARCYEAEVEENCEAEARDVA